MDQQVHSNPEVKSQSHKDPVQNELRQWPGKRDENALPPLLRLAVANGQTAQRIQDDERVYAKKPKSEYMAKLVNEDRDEDAADPEHRVSPVRAPAENGGENPE